MDIEDKKKSNEPVRLNYAGKQRKPKDAPLWFKIVVSTVVFGGIICGTLVYYFLRQIAQG